MKWSTVASLLSAIPLAFAASNTTSRATFIYNGTNSAAGNDLVWSVNTVNSTGDVYFHLMAPWSGNWVGIGFGQQMAGSLILIAYPSWNGTGVTISPRLATGHTEPTYSPNITVQKIWDSSLKTPNTVDQIGQYMYADGVCKGCAKWIGGSLDLTNANAPFIFAGGPGENMYSDDLDAPLKRHAWYGHFTMNLAAATVQASGSVPGPINGMYTAGNASTATGFSKDNSLAPSAHAGLMIAAFLVIFPIGSLVLRIFDKVILHTIVQGLGFLFVLVAFALGCYISTQYNRSKDFKSVHQIIGLILMAGVLAQLGLGIVGHRIFKKTNQPAKFMKVHIYLGMALCIVAVINGGLGLDLGQSGWLISRYAIVVVAVLILFAPLRLTAHFCVKRRNKNRAETAGMNGPVDYQYPQFVAAQKGPNVQAVPLQTFHSTDSVPQYYGYPQQARPMV